MFERWNTQYGACKDNAWLWNTFLQRDRQMAGQGTYYVMNKLLNHCTAILSWWDLKKEMGDLCQIMTQVNFKL